MLEGARRVGVGDAEGDGEVLPELMAGAHLQRLAVAHHPLAGPGPGGAGEPLARRLVPGQHGHRQRVDHGGPVDVVEDAQRVGPGVRLGGVRRVTLLPQELGGAQEQARPQLPAHDIGPLVDQQGQVAVALHPLGEEAVDDRLGGGADDEWLLQLLAAAVGHHGELGGEPLDVLGLELQEGFGDEQREVGVLRPRLLNAPVELGLHELPDAVAPGADDHGAARRAVFGHLRARHDLLVPAWEVLRPRHDRSLGHGSAGYWPR